MISLKKFLSQDTEAHQVMMHVVRILVEGIGKRAVVGDADECERFGETIKEFSGALDAGITPAELLVRAGSVLNGFEEYNHQTLKHQRLQTLELQQMVKMLTSTVGLVAAASTANISLLGDIEKQVALTSELDDIRVIKARLSGCLTDIRKEAERQQKEIGESFEILNRGLEMARTRTVSPPAGTALDVITGLPLRAAAETALADAGRNGTRAYACIIVLDRLATLNQRFGRDVGDEIMIKFVDAVKQSLGPEDRIFRWGGTAFLALLPRSDSIENVRKDVVRTVTMRLEHMIQTESRSIMLPIAARWTLFPMMASPRLLFKKIDDFTETQTLRE